MSRRRRSNDLIRIEDAIKVLCRRVCHPGILCPDAYCEEMWELLEDVEGVDAVPVVRCTDCIRYHPKSEVWGWCTMSKNMRRTDFCSYGVRKDGDHHDSN